MAPTNVPQSTTVTLSLAESGLTASESTGVVRESVKAPARLPVFSMSTVPVAAVPPGLRSLAVRTAVPSLEFRIDSVPEANVFAGLAEEAVKSAPEPTTARGGEKKRQQGAESETGAIGEDLKA